MTVIHVLVADDHKIIRDGISMLLEDEHNLNVVAEARDGTEALEICKTEDIDLVIMDINMPEMDGIEATRRIRDQQPRIKILALTMLHEDQHIRRMIRAGASGYITKSSGKQELIDAIENILNGKHYFSDEATQTIMMDLIKSKTSGRKKSDITELTDRELEVLELIVGEHTNQEIADKLFISVRTVDAHRRNLLQKTGARNTAGLVRYALDNNLF